MILDILKTIRDVKPDLISYKLCDVEDGAYYGKMDKDGNWLIMKEDAGSFRYAFGSEDYSTYWTNRATLTYRYFDGTS